MSVKGGHLCNGGVADKGQVFDSGQICGFGLGCTNLQLCVGFDDDIAIRIAPVLDQ